MASHNRSRGFRRTALPLAACLLGWMLAPARLRAAEPTPTKPPPEKVAQALVQQLGDERFAQREKAVGQLVDLGLPALPALERGRRHPDREIRYRSERVLTIIRQNDFERRLEAFATDPDGDEDYGLPAWSGYRQRFGKTTDARALFVEMLRAEASLLQALDQRPTQAAFQLEQRAQQIQQVQLRSEQVPVGGIAAMLYVASRPDVNVSAQTSQIVFQCCFQGYFHKAITEGAHRALLRSLLGMAIERAEDWPAYVALQLAMRYDLTEGLAPAIRTLSGQANNQASLPFVRQFAILTIAKFGDPAHRELLEGLLDDPTPCSSLTIEKVRYETQLRDVALAALWKIHGQDPREHGFGNRVQDHPQVVFNTGTLGFPNDDERSAALAAWREWREMQPEG